MLQPGKKISPGDEGEVTRITLCQLLSGPSCYPAARHP
jgi:hypothetical protein